MMSITTRIFAATSLLATLSLPALASTPLPGNADTNKDGFVSRAEFMTHSDQRFAATDTDGNGVLTPAERKAFRMAKREQHAQARFAKTDTNGDGLISMDEYNAARALRTQKIKQFMDVNGDGIIDIEDRQAHKERRKARRFKRQKMRHNFRPDSNGDGVIDLAEYSIVADKIFKRLDKNGDNMLDVDERGRAKKPHK